jgi:hypothetical protein
VCLLCRMRQARNNFGLCLPVQSMKQRPVFTVVSITVIKATVSTGATRRDDGLRDGDPCGRYTEKQYRVVNVEVATLLRWYTRTLGPLDSARKQCARRVRDSGCVPIAVRYNHGLWVRTPRPSSE